MTVLYFGSDHAGLELKRELIANLEGQSHEIHDLGTDSGASCDYPDFAHAVADKVAGGDALGILVCGTGLGMNISKKIVEAHGGSIDYVPNPDKGTTFFIEFFNDTATTEIYTAEAS